MTIADSAPGPYLVAMMPNVRDASSAPPRLRLELSALYTLPPGVGPEREDPVIAAALRAAGFEVMHGTSAEHARKLGMRLTCGGRVDRPEQADELARRWVGEGADGGSLHVGSGHEDDTQIDRLVAAIIEAGTRHGICMCIETHRATITQDTWRTVQIAKRHPAVRFNADFSHWYTGLEMVYGDWAAKLDFLQPVFERVRFFHGRIGNSGCIQIGLTHPSAAKAIGHFREMWTRAMVGFRRQAGPGDVLPFATELLHPEINYAPVHPDGRGGWSELGDRWSDALSLARIARECWDAAAPSPA
jgi:hypothetical protein